MLHMTLPQTSKMFTENFFIVAQIHIINAKQYIIDMENTKKQVTGYLLKLS